MKINIKYFNSVSSTNTMLFQMAKNGEKAGTVIVAEKQTEGRGRLGRWFESPVGGVYMSMLVETDNELLLTAKASVAVKRAILEKTGKTVLIKWVNDLFYENKKVAGILTQRVDKLSVVGVGINLFTEENAFSPEIKDSVTSLFAKKEDCPCKREDLVKCIAQKMYALAGEKDKKAEKTNWFDEYCQASFVLGKAVDVYQCGTKVFSGVAVSIDSACALHVLDEENKEMILSCGEITLRLGYDG